VEPSWSWSLADPSWWSPVLRPPERKAWQTQGMRTLAVAVLLVIVASACGGDSDSAELEASREEVASLKAFSTVVDCETDKEADEFGNKVTWCADGSYWWVDVNGRRFNSDPDGVLTSEPVDTSAAPTTTVAPATAPVIDLIGSPFPWESNYWGDIWQLDLSVVGCAERSGFSVDQLSSDARINLELITEKNIDDVTAAELAEITQLQFSDHPYSPYEVAEYIRPDSLVSYDGLEYLTCLQWLDLGWKSLGRDFSFLSSLSELRHLDLSMANSFQDVELLESMTKLESLALADSFKPLLDLAQLTSLRRISARGSESCNVEPLLGMPQLETLLLGDSDFHNWVELSELDRDFDISLDPTGRYMQLLIEGGAPAFNPEFDLDNLSGIYDTQYVMDIVQSIYGVVEDNYDVIAFVGNAGADAGVGYAGFAREISNNVDGLGSPIWSAASCYGSEGRLRGILTIPTIVDLWEKIDDLDWTDGSLIHETLHLWGGGDLLPIVESNEGFVNGGHWGMSSADGILGGFELESLSIVEDGVYRTNLFSHNGNSGLHEFLSPLELYMMGVLPASEIPDTTVFGGVSQVNDTDSCEDYGYEWWAGSCFRATKQTVVSVEDIADVAGERPYEGELEISLLVVAISEDPLTEAEWSRIDEHISWYAEPSAVDDSGNNMWEASGGKIRYTLPPPGG
jgi:hypothetical protein